jgi:hypothetical protein
MLMVIALGAWWIRGPTVRRNLTPLLLIPVVLLTLCLLGMDVAQLTHGAQMFPLVMVGMTEASRKTSKRRATIKFLKARGIPNAVELVGAIPRLPTYDLERKLGPTLDLLRRLRWDERTTVRELGYFIACNLEVLTLIAQVLEESGELHPTAVEVRRLYGVTRNTILRQTGHPLGAWWEAARETGQHQTARERIRQIALARLDRAAQPSKSQATLQYLQARGIPSAEDLILAIP